MRERESYGLETNLSGIHNNPAKKKTELSLTHIEKKR